MTVVGVMAPGFSFPLEQDLWMPLVPTPALQRRDTRSITFLFGRLADGATVKAARVEINTIAKQLAASYPTTHQGFVHAEVQTFREHFIGPKATIIFGTMVGAVGFVLLIGCANLANLMLARAIGRARETSLRLALGSGRWRIIRQLLVESVTLSALGGVFGWLVAQFGVRVYELAGFAPFPYSHYVDLTMDYRVLVYLIAMSTGTGLLFGLAPAIRLSKCDVNGTLKDGGRGATSGGRGRHLSTFLVVGETALAVVLLAGAGAMIHSFLNIYLADVGVNTRNVLSATLNLPAAAYPTPEAQIAFCERVERQLAAIPGVESVAITNRLPACGSMKFAYQLDGQPSVEPQGRPILSALSIGPAYFRTLQATVLSGRAFNDVDRASGLPVAIVNQRFASQYWPGQNALGKRLRLFTKDFGVVDGRTPEDWRTVVGVVSNIVQDDATRQEFGPLVYVPYRQTPAPFTHIVVKPRALSPGLATAVQREIQSLDPDLYVSVLPLSARMKRNYRNDGLLAALFVMFAAIALLLAALGLYAVIAHAVSQRTQEIGVRMAMGGTGRDILEIIVRQGMRPVAIGLAVGLAGSFAVTPVLRSVLVQVSPADPIAFTVALLVMMVAALLGCLMPARRAMRVDPVIALRHE